MRKFIVKTLFAIASKLADDSDKRTMLGSGIYNACPKDIKNKFYTVYVLYLKNK